MRPSRTPPICTLLLAAALGVAVPAAAQQPPQLVEQVYQSDLAICNAGDLSAPAREACVREAGRQRDAARGGPPEPVEMTTPDGRATVVTPQGAQVPASPADAVPSRDGRANVVPAR